MAEYILRRECLIPKPISSVFDFFSQAENLEKITPPWLNFQILSPRPIELRQGTAIAYQLRLRGFRFQWLTEIERWAPPYEFVDRQIRGPYKRWRHTHRFEESGAGTRIVDVVEYALPFGPLGRLAHWLQVRRDISKIFDYREERVKGFLEGPADNCAVR